MKYEKTLNESVDITEMSSAHMATQIRVRQLATKTTQDRLQELIIQKLEEQQENSGKELVKLISENLSRWLAEIKLVNTSFSSKEALENVGYPIKYNKTALQLEMALKWVDNREDLITDLGRQILYNGLENKVGISTLPILQSPNDKAFWGNENPSVSTVLLYSVASTLGCAVEPNTLIGAGEFYPFFSGEYILEGTEENPFIFQDGMVLFGDYQFGGHRYFSNEHPNLAQRLFSPEDCSSAVGKATSLTETQVVSINTTALRKAYGNQENEYNYQSVTSSLSDEKLDFTFINPGDIYVRGGHTAIVLGKDNFGNIQTFEFSRDIDVAENKKLGGGVYQYNLCEIPQNAERPVYILRSQIPELKESCSLSALIKKVDTNYYHYTNTTHTQDTEGDSGIFMDSAFFTSYLYNNNTFETTQEVSGGLFDYCVML